MNLVGGKDDGASRPFCSFFCLKKTPSSIKKFNRWTEWNVKTYKSMICEYYEIYNKRRGADGLEIYVPAHLWTLRARAAKGKEQSQTIKRLTNAE